MGGPHTAPTYRASYYNLTVPNGDEVLVFNARTSALLKMGPALTRALEPYLGPSRPRTAGVGFTDWQPPEFTADELPAELAARWPTLVDAGLFVPVAEDERATLRHEYERDRSAAPLFVTMTTTLDCNMRCYYCYQKDGELEHMSQATCDAIIAWTKQRIEQRAYPTLHVDWYGGEPMLNREIIEYFSQEMIPYCEARGMAYKGSMICNGTAWPSDHAAFVARNRLRNIQFTLDGPARHHNKRRGLLGQDDPRHREASFETVLETVAAVMGTTRIYLRVNVDPFVGRDCLELLDVFAAKGWLAEGTPFYPYVAMINAMTEHCGFIGKAQQFAEFTSEFDDIQREFYAILGRHRSERSLEMVQYYPNRVKTNCAAVSHNAVVFGPEGLAYKCGLDVGDAHRAHGLVAGPDRRRLLPVNQMAPDRWDKYDPFSHKTCRECQYLPVCMGGCPKAQIDRDEAQIRMQSQFWEANFDRIIREYYAAAGHA